MLIKRTLGLLSAVAIATTLAACGSSGSSSTSSSGSAQIGDCALSSKANSISITPVKAGTLTVETTLPAQGWWNGTTPDSIKSGYEYCMAAELAHMAGLSSVTVKNVSFAQLVAGHTSDFDIALAEISITPERQKVVDFSEPYFDSNIGVLVQSDSDVSESNIKTKKLAAYSGTTSVDFLKNEMGVNPTIYPNSQTLYQGVISGQVDAAFLDTAIVLAEAKASKGSLKVVGQYSTGEKYGAIYPKGSANQDALNQGITTLKSDGTLDNLSKTWLGPAFGGDPSSVPMWTIQ
ncbi:MAG TPA: ABC transporter substrate-binding protein [Nocardioides sp.]|jgi:polar amino acid transport system substrate-binding protein|nr:ABC transporter substrate-binding protein [Nocardioides sp.]